MEREVDFLFEIGTLRHVARTWNQFGGLPMANDAEHTFRVAMLAWLLASKEGADTGKVAKMALIHDLTETRCGDVHYLSRLYTERNEAKATEDQTAGVATQDEMQELATEYEERESLAARIVKDADNLDVELELKEGMARGEDFCRILHEKRVILREKLFTESARELFDAIRAADPNDWHGKASNRFTAGDWQSKK
ncbi:MAG: HD domain-containing protein [Candidatus Nomurabacteria bacterium]|jgi:putative hydrolase of HD superfamily|nr:HD domain-containing protein [Candidatus Nomurabacteria bacterium]